MIGGKATRIEKCVLKLRILSRALIVFTETITSLKKHFPKRLKPKKIPLAVRRYELIKVRPR